MEINKNNFIRFNDGNADTTALPNPYLSDLNRCGYMPLLVPGETTSFFINIKEGFNYGDFATIKLNLVAPDGSKTSINTLQKLELRDGLYNLYATLTISALITEGVYVLELIADGKTYISNSLRAILNDYQDKSVRVSYRNSRDIFGFNYTKAPDFYNSFRLHIFPTGQEYDYQLEQYRSVSTGKLRDLNGSMDKFVKFESYYFDQQAHEACAAMLFHSEITINDKRYTLKTGYKFNPLLDNKLSKGEFEFWDEEFSRLNKC